MAFSFREIFKNHKNDLSDNYNGLSFIRPVEDNVEADRVKEISESDKFSPFELVEVKEEQNFASTAEDQLENLNFSNVSDMALEIDNEEHFAESAFLLDEDEGSIAKFSQRRGLSRDEVKVRPLEDLAPLSKRTESLKDVKSFLKLVANLNEVKESLFLFPNGESQVSPSFYNGENYFSDLAVNQIKDLVSLMDARGDPLSRINCLKHSLSFIHLPIGILVLLTDLEENYRDMENKVMIILQKLG
ncbi:MAG: hypothetical protein CMO46_06730 [Verrucomicrobiales bacterium]|nr:hypothetical protein [Verrucomicrobiales bacterium]